MLYSRIDRKIRDGNTTVSAIATGVSISVCDGAPKLLLDHSPNFEIIHNGAGVIFEILPLKNTQAYLG